MVANQLRRLWKNDKQHLLVLFINIFGGNCKDNRKSTVISVTKNVISSSNEIERISKGMTNLKIYYRGEIGSFLKIEPFNKV